MGVRQAEACVDIRNIACLRGGRLLFEGLSLSVGSGEALLLEGPNGIGKSSLLRMIAGLLRPAAGTITVAGRMTLSDENLALDRERSLAKALLFWAHIDGTGQAEVDDAIDRLALAHLADIPVRMLSTGQRRRASLARVLASGAPVWLLDEPLNGLDSASAAAMGTIMEHHLGHGGTIIAASHLPLPVAKITRFVFSGPIA
jgi:heme exporter protein A